MSDSSPSSVACLRRSLPLRVEVSLSTSELICMASHVPGSPGTLPGDPEHEELTAHLGRHCDFGKSPPCPPSLKENLWSKSFGIRSDEDLPSAQRGPPWIFIISITTLPAIKPLGCQAPLNPYSILHSSHNLQGGMQRELSWGASAPLRSQQQRSPGPAPALALPGCLLLGTTVT